MLCFDKELSTTCLTCTSQPTSTYKLLLSFLIYSSPLYFFTFFFALPFCLSHHHSFPCHVNLSLFFAVNSLSSSFFSSFWVWPPPNTYNVINESLTLLLLMWAEQGSVKSFCTKCLLSRHVNASHKCQHFIMLMCVSLGIQGQGSRAVLREMFTRQCCGIHL